MGASGVLRILLNSDVVRSVKRPIRVTRQFGKCFQLCAASRMTGRRYLVVLLIRGYDLTLCGYFIFPLLHRYRHGKSFCEDTCILQCTYSFGPFLILKNIEQDERAKLAFWGTDGSILASGMLAIAVARKRVPVIGWRPRQMIAVQTWRA